MILSSLSKGVVRLNEEARWRSFGTKVTTSLKVSPNLDESGGETTPKPWFFSSCNVPNSSGPTTLAHIQGVRDQTSRYYIKDSLYSINEEIMNEGNKKALEKSSNKVAIYPFPRSFQGVVGFGSNGGVQWR